MKRERETEGAATMYANAKDDQLVFRGSATSNLGLLKDTETDAVQTKESVVHLWDHDRVGDVGLLDTSQLPRSLEPKGRPSGSAQCPILLGDSPLPKKSHRGTFQQPISLTDSLSRDGS